jgi:hypothetical protein
VRFAGEQLVLDTNVLLHFLRGKAAGQVLDDEYGLSIRSPRVIIPGVVSGELRSIAYYNEWGEAKLAQLTKLTASLPVADITSPRVVDATPDSTVQASERAGGWARTISGSRLPRKWWAGSCLQRTRILSSFILS